MFGLSGTHLAVLVAILVVVVIIVVLVVRLVTRPDRRTAQLERETAALRERAERAERDTDGLV